MNDETSAEIVRLEPAQEAIRDHFLGWQCRIRQYAVRHGGGRPTTGMCPQVVSDPEGDDLGRITVLIVKRAPEQVTAQFRHMVRRTHDPAEWYDAALRFLAAAYYQRPREFSDQMTALFAPGAAVAGRLAAAGRCRLEFTQYQQHYAIPCAVRRLAADDAAFQATYWHNGLFNAALPGEVEILAFAPDWARARAEPPVP